MPDLINPVTFTNKEEDEPQLNFSLDMDFFKSNKNIPIYAEGVEPAPPTSEKKKRGRPRKEQSLGEGTFVTPDGEGRTDAYIGTTIPYTESFNETNAMTKMAIAEIDNLNGILRNEINNVVNSKTLKKKYDYISELSGTVSNLYSTKMRAISELNKTITDAHKLEIQRIKDLKLAAAADAQDDDRRMQEMYNSFISTPTNMGMGGSFAPAMNEISFGTSNFISAANNQVGEDIGYANYINNLTPEQNMMRLEASGNAETVLVYDPMTGARQFAVVDKTTGAQIPNVPIPSDIILENTHIDSRTGMARNRDINKTYRVVQVGSPESTALNFI